MAKHYRDTDLVRANNRTQLSADDERKADLALAELDRQDQAGAAQAARVGALEERLANWIDDPDINPVLDWLLDIWATIAGSRGDSAAARNLNAAAESPREPAMVAQMSRSQSKTGLMSGS